MILNPDIGQAGTLQQTAELVGVGESENGLTLRYVGRGRCSDFCNGFAKETLNALLARVIPPR
jgi:hypothetical protein